VQNLLAYKLFYNMPNK